MYLSWEHVKTLALNNNSKDFYTQPTHISLICQTKSTWRSVREATGYEVQGAYPTNDDHGTGFGFNMTLAILPQCPTWKGQSTINKATGIGLKSGPLTWDVCPGFTPVKNVLSASCLDQLPVFRSGGMWMLTMLWDGALQ